MRLWSFHPKYLDPKGLVALWREALLAQQVLRGSTIGYRSHPQLERFKAHARPKEAIATYLRSIWREARERGYCFDAARIGPGKTTSRIACTEGQLGYEWKHLLGKLKMRDPERYRELLLASLPDPHPFFIIVPGDIAAWEAAPGRGRQVK